MFKLLIIITTCIQGYLFTEIGVDNCINGAIVSPECRYNIRFNNIGDKSLHCILKFALSNSTVKFINNGINVKTEEANKCPTFDLKIITMVNGERKDNKLSTTCGGTIDKLEKDFFDFSSFIIKFDTKGLDDQVTTIDMSLEILGCKSWVIWIRRYYLIITIATIIPVAMLGICVGVYCNYSNLDDDDDDDVLCCRCCRTPKYTALVKNNRESIVCCHCDKKIYGAVATDDKEKSIVCCHCDKNIYGAVATNDKKESRTRNHANKQNTNRTEKGKQLDCLV